MFPHCLQVLLAMYLLSPFVTAWTYQACACDLTTGAPSSADTPPAWTLSGFHPARTPRCYTPAGTPL
jgi:hypothetical protein